MTRRGDLPEISRRDFLNGVLQGGVALGAAKVGAGWTAVAPSPSDYPPAASGLQGQTDLARGAAHAQRDGLPQRVAEDRGEHYDLIVVGAGISGLAAAWLFRAHAGRPVRILIVDPLDDFGGHAKRNEFTTPDGQLLIGYGGSQSLDSPSLWSPAARSLIKALGIDLERLASWYDAGWAARHGVTEAALWFDRAHWGRDALVLRRKSPAQWVRQLPFPPRARADLLRLTAQTRDYLPGLKRSAKIHRLASISYDHYLTAHCGCDPILCRYYAAQTRGYLGVGTDAASALDAWALGLPGFDGLGLGAAMPAELAPSGRQAFLSTDPYHFHFPDGNAGVARSLVRDLLPQALTAPDMETLVTARCDYTRLDQPTAPVRLRLRTTVTRCEHEGDGVNGERVRLVCQPREGAPYTVTAAHAVLACWHRVVAQICPELSTTQTSALRDQVRTPLLYANVMLRNWQAFKRGGIRSIHSPGGFWDEAVLDFPVSSRDYRFSSTPDDPILVHLARVMVEGGGSSAREQAAAGRARLEKLSALELEWSARDVLQGALGRFGFNHERDILAVTMNRWAHGYAYEYMRPWDTYWPDGPLPNELARRGWGRIALANSDAGAFAYVHSAIDQATRAVAELLPHAELPTWAPRPGPWR